MSSEAIVATALSRTFVGGRRHTRRTIDAVRELTFTVERGEKVAFIGPNGAGKSTSIKMLTGDPAPVERHGDRARPCAVGAAAGAGGADRHAVRAALVVVARAPGLDTFRVLAAVYGIDDATAARRVGDLGELLDAADLFDQPVRTLSLGQRMRCELAVCLLHEPKLFFLDEPTIGLDLVAKQRFRELLLRLNTERGTTVFLTSHDVSDIEHVADRTIVVNDGRVIYDAPVATMRTDLLAIKRVEVTVEHGTPVGALSALARPGVVIESTAPTTIQLDVDTARHAIGAVLNDVLTAVSVIDLSVVDPPLETVIAAIYERSP